MITTPQGDFYTPKEVLEVLVRALGYPEGKYELLQSNISGLYIRKVKDERP